MFCRYCGTHIEDDATFCPNCGAASKKAVTAQTAPAPQKIESEPSKSPTGPSKESRKIIAVTSIIAVVVVIAVAIIAFNVKAASDAEALRTKTDEITQIWQDRVDAISAEGSDRTTLLTHYQELAALQTDLDSAKSNGDLALPDGSTCDLSDISSQIESKQTIIQNWFVSDYESRLASASLTSNASADNTSKDTAQSAATALEELRSDLLSESAIWGSDTASGSKYADFVSRIDTQMSISNSILSQILSNEEAAAAEAAAQAAETAAHTYECEYFTMYTPSPWSDNKQSYCVNLDCAIQSYEEANHVFFARGFTHGNSGCTIYVVEAGYDNNPWQGRKTESACEYIGTTSTGCRVWHGSTSGCFLKSYGDMGAGVITLK